jgi:hypothetical protein
MKTGITVQHFPELVFKVTGIRNLHGGGLNIYLWLQWG